MGAIGERNAPRRPRELERAAEYIEASLSATGLRVRSQPFRADGASCRNIEAEHQGASQREQIVVIGAHYDTASGTPSTDDNASGIAVVLALAALGVAVAGRRGRPVSGTRP